MATYSFVKSTVNSDALTNEIRSSPIVTALDYVTYVPPTALDITFKGTLSAGDQTILGSIVSAHTGDISANITIVKDTFLNHDADYSELKYVKVATGNTDTTGGLIVPSNKTVGLYRLRLTGADSTMHVIMAFDYGGPSQKVYCSTRGSVDLYLNPLLAMNQITGNGVKKLCILCVNDSGTESPFIGGSWEATTIAG